MAQAFGTELLIAGGRSDDDWSVRASGFAPHEGERLRVEGVSKHVVVRGLPCPLQATILLCRRRGITVVVLAAATTTHDLAHVANGRLADYG